MEISGTSTEPTVAELWDIIKKEITGIQLLWETANGLYFQPQGKGMAVLKNDTPLVFSLMQTALMESLLMRVSRLMDPDVTGNGKGQKDNLSLKRLVKLAKDVGSDEEVVSKLWDSSALKNVRDKYLSHNDLNRSLAENHTLNIPLQSVDIEALKALVKGLRELRVNINRKLLQLDYLDKSLDLHIQRELKVFDKTLIGGEL